MSAISPLLPTIPRALDLKQALGKKSHFLYGPRQTGKSSLARHELGSARFYSLLDSATYLALSQRPSLLWEEWDARRPLVVVDEIQRMPHLLNEVHRLIEEKGARFLLTGSSARQLRRGGINLLGGRARTLRLHPLSCHELGDRFDLARAVAAGTIPSIYLSDDSAADLQSYAGDYLQQEIVAEGATRNIPAFSRFLRVAALCNAQLVNFSNIANDAQVPRTTIHEYFEILKDTLILHEIPAWRESVRRKPAAASKAYFFDVGVAGWLQGRAVKPRTPEFGPAFETLVLNELICHRDYRQGEPIHHWRTATGTEVDFLLGDHTAIEVKARENVPDSELKALRALSEEKSIRRLLCVTLEPRPRTVGGIQLLPWREFVGRLWAGEWKG